MSTTKSSFSAKSVQSSKRDIFLLLTVYLGAILLAVALSPSIYACIHWANACWPCNLSNYLSSQSFSKIFNRVLYFFLCIGYIPLLFRRKLAILRCHSHENDKVIASFFGYFFGGVCVTLAVAILQIQFYHWHWRTISWPISLCRIFVSALTVAICEEIFFRGLLLRALENAFGLRWALPLCSIAFAHVHFPNTVTANELQNLSGRLTATLRLFSGIGAPHRLIPFASLFLLGMLLGMLTVRHRRLLPAIALHGGIVFSLLLYRKTVYFVPAQELFWGKNNLLDFPLCPLFLTALVGICGCIRRKNS
ncbi:MAG: CPBP family intramembrane metalloprotease [Puniceicoccales bacterium]|jgi:membrane protease YdiL (CAAX protease family)|nr:CPBP family intramembrane metalloprotease [Puniceicoccales bacterium]